MVCKADHVLVVISLNTKKEYRFYRKKQKLWEHEIVFSFYTAVVRYLGIDGAFGTMLQAICGSIRMRPTEMFKDLDSVI